MHEKRIIRTVLFEISVFMLWLWQCVVVAGFVFQEWYSVHVHGEVTDDKHGFLFIVLCCSILLVISSWIWQVNTLQTNCHNTIWSLTELKCKSQKYYHSVCKPYGNSRTQRVMKCTYNMKLRCIWILLSWTLLRWSYHFIHWRGHTFYCCS